jgi:molecular chaperone DnaK
MSLEIMSRAQQLAIGIDLGTTFSTIAILDDLGRPLTLNNSEGDKLTPSAVFFDSGEIVVGKEAVKALATNAIQVVECAKRKVGQRVFDQVLDGRQYPPEAIQAWVLNKLRLDSQQQIGEFPKVVITVPAYFDEIRRKSTQDAGYIAGFEVMDIINEPTAAAISFGFQRGLLADDGQHHKSQTILVYDLGGGTFDVTVMQISGDHFVALATDGDVQLGGRDWDQRLVDLVAEEFIRMHGIDPREDPNTNGRVWRDCEDAKRTLTARTKTVIGCDYQGQTIRLEVTRDRFQEITQDLLDRTAFTTRQTLQASGLQWSDLDRVLLVGGSTRMPAVVALLNELSGMIPDRSVSPDEAVAHGAVLHAALLLDRYEEKPPAFRVTNVNSHSLGVVATDPQTGRLRNAIVIPRNTPLPTKANRIFRTQKEGQTSILVQIVEGESPSPEDCSRIGKCTVRPLPPKLPALTAIDVGFRYEENGRLQVRVECAGQELKHEITRDNSLTQDQLDSWREYISGAPPFPATAAGW